MGKKILCLLICLAFLLPIAWAFGAQDERPLTPEELAEFEGEVPGVEKELNSFIYGLTQPKTIIETPTKFHKYFKVKKKSSSPTRAIRRAKNAVKAQMGAYMDSLKAQGWIPVDNPEPIIKYKYKFGWSSFKYYCRISIDLTIWCIKTPE